MLAAGEQLYLQEIERLPAAEQPILQPRLLGTGLGRCRGIRLIVALDGGDVVAQGVGVGRRIAAGQCPVCLVYLAEAQHLVETAQSLRCLGEDYGAAHRAVETVHHSDKYIARLGVALLDKSL